MVGTLVALSSFQQDPVSQPSPLPAATTPRSRAWLRVLLIALALGCLAFALRDADWRRAGHLLADVGPLILMALVPQGLWTVLHAASWQRLLQGLGHRVGLLRLTSLLVTAEAVRMTMPAGPAVGESLGLLLLRDRHGVPIADGLASVAAKKALTVFTNALYAGVALALGWAGIAAASGGLFGGRWQLPTLVTGSILSLLVMSLGLAWGLRSGSPARFFARIVGKIPSPRLRQWLRGREQSFADTDARLAAPFAAGLGRLASPTALLLVQWACEAAETVLIFRLLGIDVPLAGALAIEVCASLLRSLSFALPGGIGVQDAGYVALLGGYGVVDAPTAGMAFVAVKRAKELVWNALGYVLLAVSRTSRAALADAKAAPTATAVATTVERV